MIHEKDIVEIGRLLKPHGINGEIVAILDVDPTILKCIIVKIEGINVPFFLNAIRPKGNDSFLVRIDGIESENDASSLCGNAIYALRQDLTDVNNRDEDVFYANDLIGFSIIADGCMIGTVTDIEDSTENALFIVTRTNGTLVYIPIVDEFIVNLTTDTKTIEMELPEGILEL